MLPTKEDCQRFNRFAWNECFVVTRYGEAPKGQRCEMDYCIAPAVCYLQRNDHKCPKAIEGFWWCGQCADGGG